MAKKKDPKIAVVIGGRDICRIIPFKPVAGKYEIKMDFLENEFDVIYYELFSKGQIKWELQNSTQMEITYHKGEIGVLGMNDKVKVNKWMYSTIFLSICVLVLAGFLYKEKTTSKLTMGNQISNETQSEVIPTELEVREKMPEAVKYSSHIVNYLGGDLDSEKIAADYFPSSWQTGVLIVHFYDSESWPNEAVPRMASFLMVKSKGGIIYSTWGATGGILHFKDYTEIASFVNIASNGSTLYLPIWRGTNLWSREEIWDRNYLLNEDNIIQLQKENK